MSANKKTNPIHLLIRFSDSRLKDGDTIAAHNAVIEREGAVWFGKMGSTVAQQHIDILNDQIAHEIPTFVYLVKGNRRKSTAYRGRLALASKTLPDGDDHMVPGYYAEMDIPKYVKFWVQLTEINPLEWNELVKFRASSSIMPLPETLYKSSSGHFILKEK